MVSMRVFWHEGGLHIHPESEHEGRMLVEIVAQMKFEKPPEMRSSNPVVCSSGRQEFIDSIVGNHQVVPSGVSSQLNDKNPIIRIDERR
jgi:hypothetical protein